VRWLRFPRRMTPDPSPDQLLSGRLPVPPHSPTQRPGTARAVAGSVACPCRGRSTRCRYWQRAPARSPRSPRRRAKSRTFGEALQRLLRDQRASAPARQRPNRQSRDMAPRTMSECAPASVRIRAEPASDPGPARSPFPIPGCPARASSSGHFADKVLEINAGDRDRRGSRRLTRASSSSPGCCPRGLEHCLMRPLT
jgi:hypothetical protein